MKAEIISIGTEIILGSTLNTNTHYLTQKMTDIGIDVLFHTSVSDDSKALEDVVNIALNRTDLLVLTGGLGPTMDDITMEVVSDTLGLDIELDCEMKGKIEKHSYRPRKSQFLINEIGTAPGIYIEREGKIVILLPGPPKEMKLMFDKYTIPLIKQDYIIKTNTINTIGIGESELEIILKEIIERNTNPTIATYAKESQVDIKIVAKGKSKKEVNILLRNTIADINKKIKKYIYSYNNKRVEEVVFEKLKEQGMMVAFCESCTGGLISSRFTKISGVSEVFDRGIVTYSNKSKMNELGVLKETLDQYGAVSKQTAMEMANGLLNKTEVDVAISTTGVAGPSGGTKEKPVGLVYIGIATRKKSFVVECFFNGNRNSIQNKATIKTFNELIKAIT